MREKQNKFQFRSRTKIALKISFHKESEGLIGLVGSCETKINGIYYVD
jgi:hypothetical protein